ncbi:serine hydrolase domain-containing protein [Novosphingobium aquae]|uniref:Serine hydrolase domain-containing protein n=1 Tax=Novosphingobium aquae TaxID=3133435 RepID=A0ABU8S9M8_9SPHN
MHRSVPTALIACALISASAVNAASRDFTHALRRSITIAGHESERFRLKDRMAHYAVPGLSVAVIDKCRIIEVRAFGNAAPGGEPVTRHTLFQAGSISKVVTAVAALKLVEQGRLSLDADIRARLTSWHLPESPLLAGRSITLRGLLGHTAGINQEGGIGYPRGSKLPTLREILEGRPPANTASIRVEHAPETAWRYSGGGYYITQALMQDVTGEAYPALVSKLVFRPLGLKEGSFSHPLDQRHSLLAARAVGPDGSPLEGGWRENPELAAGGLWTTPHELARFVISIAHSVRGEAGGVLSAASARELMTRGLGNWGLGVDLGSPDQARHFGHTGHNVGFTSEFILYPDSCKGAVVMNNADQGGWLNTEVLRAIGDTYGWPDRIPAPVQSAIPLTDAIAARFVGTYQLRDFPSERFVISRRVGGLYWARHGHIGRDLIPATEGKLFSPDSKLTLSDAARESRAETLTLSFGARTNVAIRVAD